MVVDRENHVLGVFTKVDIIMALFKQADLLNARLQAVYRAMHNGLINTPVPFSKQMPGRGVLFSGHLLFCPLPGGLEFCPLPPRYTGWYISCKYFNSIMSHEN